MTQNSVLQRQVVPQLVATLPANPWDGQEVYYLADPANGVIWHLRYRAAAVGSYKWEFVGGSPMYHEVATQQTTTSTTYIDLATVGPQVTLPLAGDYEFTYAVTLGANGGQYALAAPKLGSSAVNDNDAILGFSTGGVTDHEHSVARVLRRYAIAAGALVKMQYRQSGGTGGKFAYRSMSVRPVRVG